MRGGRGRKENDDDDFAAVATADDYDRRAGHLVFSLSSLFYFSLS